MTVATGAAIRCCSRVFRSFNASYTPQQNASHTTGEFLIHTTTKCITKTTPGSIASESQCCVEMSGATHKQVFMAWLAQHGGSAAPEAAAAEEPDEAAVTADPVYATSCQFWRELVLVMQRHCLVCAGAGADHCCCIIMSMLLLLLLSTLECCCLSAAGLLL